MEARSMDQLIPGLADLSTEAQTPAVCRRHRPKEPPNTITSEFAF
jgi:hypothetical protein